MPTMMPNCRKLVRCRAIDRADGATADVPMWYTPGASERVSFKAVWLLPWHEMA